MTYLKNPLAFQDEFWSTFIGIWIAAAAFLFNTSFLFLKTYSMPIAFYMCTGQDPTTRQKMLPFFPFLETFSFLTMVSVTIRIKLHKRQGASGATASVAADVEKRSLASTMVIFGIVCLVTLSSVTSIVLDKQQPQELNLPPYTLLSYYRSLISPQLGSALVSIAFILNKHHLRTLLDEISHLKI